MVGGEGTMPPIHGEEELFFLQGSSCCCEMRVNALAVWYLACLNG